MWRRRTEGLREKTEEEEEEEEVDGGPRSREVDDRGRLMRWGGEVESCDGLGEGDSLKRSRVQISCLQS